MAASSRRPMPGGPGGRFSMINRPGQLAPSPFRFRIRMLSTWEAAKVCIGRTSPWATASISLPTRARPGRISGFAMPSKSRSSRLTRAVPTGFLSRRPDILMGRMRNAVSSVPLMAARLSRKSYPRTRTPARPTFKSIRAIPRRFTRRFGNRARGLGKIAVGMGPVAAFLSRLMAERLGINSTKVCRMESCRLIWRSRPAHRALSSPPSPRLLTPSSIARKMAAKTGRWRRTMPGPAPGLAAAICPWCVSIPRTLTSFTPRVLSVGNQPTAARRGMVGAARPVATITKTSGLIRMTQT